MSETKHTSGPWKAEGAAVVAKTVVASCGWHGGHAASFEEAVANANLIAAALDMLEALKLLVETYMPEEGSGVDSRSVPDELVKACYAIDKAEGTTE